MLFKNQIINPLFNEPEIQEKATRLLKDAGCYDVLPTPLDTLVNMAGLKCYKGSEHKQSFLLQLSKAALSRFLGGYQRLRGWADLRERVIYIPEGQTKHRERFAQAHEIIHQVLDWHHIGDCSFADYDGTLSPAIKDEFEREANFGAAELLFQGKLFEEKVRSYAASMDSAMHLAKIHDASFQSALWKYVEAQDEQVCLLQYYPQDDGCFRRWKPAASSSFLKRYAEIDPPRILRPEHDWVQAVKNGGIISGTQLIECGSEKIEFQWSARWNSYSLSIMLRRKPAGHKIGSILMPSKKLWVPSRKLVA